MINRNPLVEECKNRVDEFLKENKLTPISKKEFPVDGGELGVVYKLGHFGIEISKHQFIIFSQFNSRHIDMDDYSSADEVLDYVLPIAQQFIDEPEITKHIVVRQINKVKKLAARILGK